MKYNKPNFKDEGCMFGGAIFEELVDKSSDIFNNLEPPKPSLVVHNPTSGNVFYRSLGSQSAPISMSAYNDPRGGCVDAYCTITMFNGTSKLLKDVKKFDIIKSIDNNYQTMFRVLTERTKPELKRYGYYLDFNKERTIQFIYEYNKVYGEAKLLKTKEAVEALQSLLFMFNYNDSNTPLFRLP
jgi:hypothetical protein